MDTKKTPVPTFECPHCGVVAQQKLLWGDTYVSKEWVKPFPDAPTTANIEISYAHQVYRCVHCERDTYQLVRSGPPDAVPRVVHRYPVSMPVIHVALDKKQDIVTATIEAEKCLAVGAYSACGCAARRVIHCICQDMQAKGDNLYEQLKDLKDKQLITPSLWEWAEELRIIGRSGAHPEWEDISPDDADYAVRFLREIIRYLYINPYELKQRRYKETVKKK